MPESLIDHIRRLTGLTSGDATDAAQAVAEWCDRRSRSARLLPAMALRSVARIIQAEVDREREEEKQ